MNPDIYSNEEISSVQSLLKRFRAVISDNEELYGFSISDLDDVIDRFPGVDLFDEGSNDYDASGDVLNNMFAFLLDDNPKSILSKSEYLLVSELWGKLKNA
ncbi:hypothetical protein [Saccharophagus degradans]|uniref:Colicin D immunity protein domain-containing protein n=1 Tax=Saccharophagus degradans TaxID=86304 RepID=A0AAW7X440_9GAMM|nr:hypothetical protein [Saccharophagus degradans]MDO6422305.1 hypothetical protein [Saccharophagus degradans]MDO6608155.1 hypothetical protein [Saccharophagus degradans]